MSFLHAKTINNPLPDISAINLYIVMNLAYLSADISGSRYLQFLGVITKNPPERAVLCAQVA